MLTENHGININNRDLHIIKKKILTKRAFVTARDALISKIFPRLFSFRKFTEM